MSTGEVNWTPLAVIFFVSVFIAFVAGFGWGMVEGQWKEQRAAAKAGVAEYRIDPETGTSVFTYRKEKP